MCTSTSAPASALAPVIVVGTLAGDPGGSPPIALRVVRHGGTYRLLLPQGPGFVVAVEDLHEAVTETWRAYEESAWYRRRGLKPLNVDTDIGELQVSYRPDTVQLDFPWTFIGSRQVFGWFGSQSNVSSGVEARITFGLDRLLTALARADVAADFSGRHKRLMGEDYAWHGPGPRGLSACPPELRRRSADAGHTHRLRLGERSRTRMAQARQASRCPFSNVMQ
jgi:hypothetical protein